MNNYLSLNLVSGRLSRFAGGGRPIFTLGENNDVQLYFLDYPIPSTYPSTALGDAFSEITTRDFNNETLIINAGKRGGSKILSSNLFSNLPNNFNTTASTSIETFNTTVLVPGNIVNVTNITYSGTITLSSVPTIESLFRFDIYLAGQTFPDRGLPPPIPVTQNFRTSYFSFNDDISDLIKSAIKINVDTLIPRITSKFYHGYAPVEITNSCVKISDYTYNFEYTTQVATSEVNLSNLSFSISIDSSRATSNFGKYGILNFSSPNWNSIIGSKNEVQIWIEAMIGNQTLAQGNALLRKVLI